MLPLKVFLIFITVSLAIASTKDIVEDNNVNNLNNSKKTVTYDGRSLIINGKRELLFSGSIHYTRSTPEMWPELLDKARKGGLNMIQTYVFWNAHETEKGKFNFEGQYDLVKFIKLIQEKGMYVTLRVGPFIQAEWNHGYTVQTNHTSLPYGLKTGQLSKYRVFGDPPSQRSAEDIAFSIARFFSKNGCLANYYMYHGGTNFGRTSSAFSTTRYYDEAPLDEFGLQREPKWSHLRDVHKALNLCKKALLSGQTSVTKLSLFHEIVSQHNSRNYKKSKAANDNIKWEVFSESIPTFKQLPVKEKNPAELYSMLKDKTDYAWYTTSVELGPEDFPKKNEISPVLRVMSLGHSMLVFVNGEYIGSGHGSHEEKTFEFQKTVKFKVGVNDISMLAATVGLPDSGAYMEHRYAGPKSITILGLNSGTVDLTHNGWGNQVGLHGEKNRIFSKEGSYNVQWKDAKGKGQALSWYKTTFGTPEGRGPVAIKMHGMGKGMIWVNGLSIGRHWMSYLSPLGEPTQSDYHIPRAFLKEKENLLVILEEEEASPENITILRVNRDTICSFITENHPPNVKSWASKDMKLIPVVDKVRPEAFLKCPNHKTILAVDFASYGDPVGYCGSFSLGKCNAPNTKQIVEQHCLGKETCSVPLDKPIFIRNNEDGCPGVKSLAIQVLCGTANSK
ncbi:unnamed protein product [Lupinus luteus]|uniref:beta-galactosidase n=1 Tax=Lupinus luteus TaxID=3873 RepID=A0AAV1YKP9_LUPLU